MLTGNHLRQAEVLAAQAAAAVAFAMIVVFTSILFPSSVPCANAMASSTDKVLTSQSNGLAWGAVVLFSSLMIDRRSVI